MVLHPGHAALRSVVAVVAAGLLLSSSAAASAPAPEHGPTSGGTSVSDLVPERVTLVDVSSSGSHSVAIGSDGQTYAWGENSGGTVGDGTTTDSTVPVPVKTPDGVTFTQISAGHDQSLATGSDGQTYAWGYGNHGQLGNGSTIDSTVPVPVSTPDGITFTQISAGGSYSVAIGSDGQTYAWGNGDNGHLGNGSTTHSTVPVPVSTPDGVTFTQISTGPHHSLATGSDGQTYAWGNGNHGQLGDGSATDSTVPVRVSTPDGVTFTQISAGGSYSVAIGSDGQTYAWGSNGWGQLGNGTPFSSTVPARVSTPDGVTFTQVSAGVTHSVATGSDGRTYAWGLGTHGQLGNGTTISSRVPVTVDSALTVQEVTFGGAPGVGLVQDDPTWSVTTPPHACGPVDVAVIYTHLGQTRTQLAPAGFTFGSPPHVTTHPTGTHLPAQGGQVELTATADGDDVPTVQWQQAPAGTEDWTTIPDATSSTLQTVVTTATDFRAAFTNCLATETTDTATVTLAAMPGLTPVLPPGSGLEPEPSPEPAPTLAPDPTLLAGAIDGDPDPGAAAPGDVPLARTGTDALRVTALALALAAGGTALVLARRRPAHD